MNLSLADAALLTLHEAALLPLQYSLPMIGDGIEVVPSYGRFHVHKARPASCLGSHWPTSRVFRAVEGSAVD